MMVVVGAKEGDHDSNVKKGEINLKAVNAARCTVAEPLNLEVNPATGSGAVMLEA